MNEPIPMSAFPKFLDDESAHFLLQVSEKELEAEKHEKKLNNLRKDIKNKRPGSALSSASVLVNSVRKRLREISQSSIGQPLKRDLSTMNTDNSDIKFAKITNTSYHEISELRSKIASNHEFIKEITTQEIKRVTDLYQINTGNAEDVGLFHVIKCLVGDKVREFNKYTRISSLASKMRGSILVSY